jgi:hypothetical protein
VLRPLFSGLSDTSLKCCLIGYSAVTRFAIKLAHEKMEELREEREMKAKEFQQLQRKMESLAENV